jgi:AraC family transcriptional regulator
MRDENVFDAMSCPINVGIEHAPEPSDMSGSSPSASLPAPVPERVGRLLKQAIADFETNREAAWRYLNQASTLLGAELGTMGNVCPPGGLASWRARRTSKYVEDNLASTMSIPQMADDVGLSKSHFSRAFKRTIGFAPGEYVIVRRVERAKLMMLSGKETLTGIAMACGFADQSHFSRSFRNLVGMTPGGWRRSYGRR